MALSPDSQRHAVDATPSLADAAIECLREAVVVVDARLKDLPVVLANATARRCLLPDPDSRSYLGSSLHSWLNSAAASAIDAVDSLSNRQPSTQRVLAWRFARGAVRLATELRCLPATGQRLVMLTFAASDPEPDLLHALEQLSLDLLILDLGLNVTYANAGAARSCGAAPGTLAGRSALGLTPTVALPRAAFERALQGGHYHGTAELAAAGTARYFEVDMQPLKASSGIVGVVVFSLELTERRAQKREQGPSDRRLRALTEHARDIITVAAPDGRVQYISGGLTNSLGYTQAERHDQNLFDHVHPDDAQALRSRFQQLTDGVIGGFTQQFRARHKDGSYRWLESTHVAALDNPLVQGVVINSRDVTERKQAEARLAQREEVFRLAAEAVDGIIFEWDIGSGVVHRSRGVYEVLGLQPEDLAPAVDAWRERIHPHDFAASHQDVSVALIGGRGWTTTYRIRDARGRYRSVLDRALIQRNAGGDPIRVIGCCVDVTQIKRLTDLLAEAQRTARMGAWEYSYATGELAWTEEMYRIVETTPRDFAVTWESMLALCLPDSRLRFEQACRHAESTGEPWDLELELTTRNQQRLWVRVIGHLERLDGRPFRAFGSVQNVHSQKLAQIALETRTEWLKLSMNMAAVHAWRWERATDLFEVAMVGEEMRISGTIAGMKKLLARVHPKDRPALNRAIDRAFDERAELREEFRLKAPDGRYRSYVTVARPLFDAPQRPCGLVGVSQDVTGRRDAERRLRRSEQLLRATTANTADTLVLIDTELRIRFINRAVAELPIEQITDRDISVLLPEAARAAVTSKLKRVLASGETATYEFEAVDPDGELRFFENRAVLVRDDSIGTGISISVRDITERKRLEQELLEVSSRERRAIGRDLHDGLGQELTGVALMLRGLATRIQKQAPETVDYVNEIVGVVNQSIESARALARGLLPVRTDSGGLPFALRALAGRSRDLYGLQVNFRADAWPELALSEENASHLYRIAQEALTNAARHGQASVVDIFLQVTESSFRLRIADDGIGIGGGPKRAAGMGLKIMQYRARMIGAKFDITPIEPRGTMVQVSCEQTWMMRALESAPAEASRK